MRVDLSYPKTLHKGHSGLPLAPEHVQIEKDDLGLYAKKAFKLLHGDKSYKSSKLSTTFNDRIEYTVHFANLKFYLQSGLKLKKVHQVLAFRQAPVMKEFAEYCTKMRSTSKTKSRKELYKLIANSCFGKTIERPEKFLNCRLITNADDAKRQMTHHLTSNFKIISEDLVAVFKKRVSCVLKQPIGLGFTILESSKLFMFKAYYEKIIPIFGSENVKLLFTDTDMTRSCLQFDVKKILTQSANLLT